MHISGTMICGSQCRRSFNGSHRSLLWALYLSIVLNPLPHNGIPILMAAAVAVVTAYDVFQATKPDLSCYPASLSQIYWPSLTDS